MQFRSKHIEYRMAGGSRQPPGPLRLCESGAAGAGHRHPHRQRRQRDVAGGRGGTLSDPRSGEGIELIGGIGQMVGGKDAMQLHELSLSLYVSYGNEHELTTYIREYAIIVCWVS